MVKIQEPPCPPHLHVWTWSFDQWGEVFDGVECTFTYEIPPGPRGKRWRVRTCKAGYDADQLLLLLNYREQSLQLHEWLSNVMESFILSYGGDSVPAFLNDHGHIDELGNLLIEWVDRLASKGGGSDGN